MNNLDTLDVHVEMNDRTFSDTVTQIAAREHELENAMHSLLGIAANVVLVQPKSIERSIGKAVRVIDKRKK